MSAISTFHQTAQSELYPTPDEVIDLMLAPYSQYSHDTYPSQGCRYITRRGLVLDPHGGMGNVLDALHQRYSVSQPKLMSFEICDELRYLLQGKGYRILGRDFLSYQEAVRFGLIVMNPPFSESSKHFCKAWSLLEDGGDLVGLANWQSIANPLGADDRRLAQLISKHGSVKNIGCVFAKAKRRTDVQIALIRLKCPEAEFSNFTAANSTRFCQDKGLSEDNYNPNTLAVANEIESLVSRYDAAYNLLLQRHESQRQLWFYLEAIPDPAAGTFDVNPRTGVESPVNSLEQKFDVSEQILALKARFWNAVFTQTNLGSKTTSKFQKDFRVFLNAQSAMSFTVENVKEVLYMFLATSQEQMKRALVDCFEKATAYHKKNAIWHEGWTSNKSWKIHRRVIIPWGVSYQKGSFSVDHRFMEFIDDLDKVLCWIAGCGMDEIVTAKSTLERLCYHTRIKSEQLTRHQSTHLDIKMHVKGTVHIWFRDEKILADFNRIAAEGKGWIGGKGY